MFSIDNTTYNMPCKITREAKMEASEISGMMLDKSYFNDVLGTFMTYGITVVVPLGKEDLYSSLYETLTDPVDAHTFVLPYNQTTVVITGRVETVSDEYYREYNSAKVWRKTSFSVIANHPTKTYSLAEMVSRGLTPLPNVANPEDGTMYKYVEGSGWVEITEPYPDADERAY